MHLLLVAVLLIPLPLYGPPVRRRFYKLPRRPKRAAVTCDVLTPPLFPSSPFSRGHLLWSLNTRYHPDIYC